MAARADVTPNRRGVRSRELVLDAAERVMAEHGFDGASVARVVEEAGIPISSVYHYFGSKDGILLAVMERGAEQFFGALPQPTERLGDTEKHLDLVSRTLVAALRAHPDFLRLLIVFATQPRAGGVGEVQAVVGRIRATALTLLTRQLALAFGDQDDDPIIVLLARFALAAIDGAFVAAQTDPSVELERVLLPWAASLGCLRDELRSNAGGRQFSRRR